MATRFVNVGRALRGEVGAGNILLYRNGDMLVVDEVHGFALVSYNAAISACEKSRQWEVALVLLEGLRDVKVEPNTTPLQRRDQRLREERAVADRIVTARHLGGGTTAA
ncbi:unnamed protein product [Prorocentrum cordatum]|uniref:Uncharacterized protein n=1 Tax=Prorocentrum cordatum TaxID=2364126 RepID=A0ABN9TH01_9DINO|nr:unnamed protein product [Polarella glacialis]